MRRYNYEAEDVLYERRRDMELEEEARRIAEEEEDEDN